MHLRVEKNHKQAENPASNRGKLKSPSENPDSNRSKKITPWFNGFFRKGTPSHPSPRAIGDVDSSVDVVKKEALKPEDHIIAVIGRTGAGKSTFISTATGRDSGVGHGLQSVTSQVSAVRISTPGAADVVLVDTPGFDDTYLSDLQVLKLISDWLQTTYRKGATLSGILYLHPISDNRMAGTPLRLLDMFRKLCGEDTFHKVTFVTTMWQDVDAELGLTRQGELRQYWRELASRGSKIMCFDGRRGSAWAILDPLIACESDKHSVHIQKELVGLKKDLSNTAAGQQFYSRIEKLVERQKDVLKRMREELKNTTDLAVMEALVAELQSIQKEGEKAMADMRQLDSSMIRRALDLFRY